MSSGPAISEAKQWCRQARELIKLNKLTSKGSDVTDRADKVAKELALLQKQVDAGKGELNAEQLRGYLDQFTAISGELREAASGFDSKEVDRLSNRLSELKKQLAVHLATSVKAKKAATAKLETRQAGNLPADLEVAQGLFDTLNTHAYAGDITGQIAGIQGKLTAAGKNIADEDYAAARTLIDQVAGDAASARTAADEVAVKVAKYDKARAAAQTLLDALDGNAHKDVIQAEIDAIRTTKIDEAKTKADARDFAGADALLGQVAAACTSAEAIAAKYEAYVLSSGAAQALLDGLVAHAHQNTIVAEIADIQDNKIGEAKTNADARDFDAAEALLAEVAGLHAAAMAIADRHEAFVQLFVVARDLVTDLGNHGRKDVIQADIDDIRTTRIDESWTKAVAHDFDAGEALLADVAGLCTAAREVGDRYDAYVNSHNVAQGLVTALQGHAQHAWFEARVNAIQADKIDAGWTKAEARDFDGGEVLLADVAGLCTAAEGYGDAYGVYVQKRDAAQLLVDGLTSLPREVREYISETTDTIKEVQKNVDDAKTLVEGEATKLADLGKSIDIGKLDKAGELLAKVAAPVAKAEALIVPLKAYATVRIDADTKVAALESHAEKDVIATEIAAIKAKYLVPATKFVDDGTPDKGTTLLAGVAAEVTKAKTLADRCAVVRINVDAWVTQKVATLKTHAESVFLTKEIAGIVTDAGKAVARFDSRFYDIADRMAGQVFFRCERATTAGNSYATFKPLLAAAQTLVTNLGSHAQKAVIANDIATLQKDKLDAAAKLAEAWDFIAATDLVSQVAAPAGEARTIADKQVTYLAARDAAQALVDGLKTHAQKDAIAGEIADIEKDRIGEAAKKVAARDYDGAAVLLGQVAANVDAARVVADQHGVAGKSADEVDQDAPKALAAAAKLLADLKAHPQGPAIVAETDPIQAKLVQADVEIKAGRFPEAKALLKQVAVDCVAGKKVADAHAKHLAGWNSADGVRQTLAADPQKDLIAADLVKIAKSLSDANLKAVARDYAAAGVLVETAKTDSATAKKVLVDHTKYAADRDATQLLATALDTHAKKADIATEIEEIKNGLAEAKKKADLRDYAGAQKEVEDADDLCIEAKAKADLKGGAVSGDDLKKLAKRPGGNKRIDKLVAGMGPKPTAGVIKAALEARFDMSLESFNLDETAKLDTKGSRSLKKIYDLMKDVPDTHTKDNPKLKKIKRYGGDAVAAKNTTRGSFYQTGTVVLSCGRVKDTHVNALGLADAEEDCKPKDAVAPKYFDHTTLHEVGHAVDDKAGFMSKNGAGDAYGGWKEFGRDVSEVAKAVSDAFTYDVSYVEELMLRSSPQPPPPPTGTTQVAWDAAQKKVEDWYKAMNTKVNPWADGAASKKYTFNGMVYHEAYDNWWVGYKLSARTKGISTYQFRAPGEWFSELYAAYHCKKLKDAHPAVSWLKAL